MPRKKTGCDFGHLNLSEAIRYIESKLKKGEVRFMGMSRKNLLSDLDGGIYWKIEDINCGTTYYVPVNAETNNWDEKYSNPNNNKHDNK